MTRVIMLLILLTISAFLMGCGAPGMLLVKAHEASEGITDLHLLAMGPGRAYQNAFFSYDQYESKRYYAQTVKDARKLLKSGADVNAKTKSGWTALLYAVQGGHGQMVPVLLEYGADVNAKDKDDNTALHLAVLYGDDVATVKALLAGGADVNVKEKDGWTALHVAAKNGQEQMVKALVAGGADVAAKNKKGWTPRDVAKNNNIIQLLDGR